MEGGALMATQIYKVQDPTGAMREIEGPAGASDADVIAQAQKLFAAPSATTEIPGQRKKPTMGELALSAPPARLLMGAASPLVGAVQLGANVGDYLGAKMGQKPVVGKAISDWWNNLQEMKTRGMAASEPKGITPVDILGGAGTAATALLAPAAAAPKVLSTSQKLLEGAKLGTLFGAAAPGAGSLQENVIGAAVGGTVGAAAPFAIPAAASAAGWVWDALKGKLVQVNAGRIIREVSGSDLPGIQAALRTASPNLTAAQAVQEAGINNPAFQALSASPKIAGRTPALASADAARIAAEEAARKATISNVTPDIAAMIKARDIASNPLYDAAKKEVVTLDAPFMDLFSRMPKGTVEKAADIARMDKRPFMVGEYVPAHTVETGVLDAAGNPVLKNVPDKFPEITGESLHYLKRALSDIANAPASAQGAGRDTQKAAGGVLTDFLKKFEVAVPKYGEARRTFAAASEPVNQAQVLNEMLSVLQKPGGGERVTPFLNALGRGEQAMLKRSTGFPRYNDIGEVLTGPGQMGAVNKVAGELTRDTAMELAAKYGQPAVSRILREETKATGTLPFLSTVTSIYNKVVNTLEGRVSKATLDAVANGMQSGAAASDLLATIPFKERNAVLKALTQSNALTPNPGGVAGAGVANMLAPRKQNQNALAP
jgi:hypothetical protein